MGRKRAEPKQLTGVVDDINHDGLGVIRVDDKVWFVDAVLPGEEIVFWTGPRRRNHGIGRLDHVVSASDSRADPPCTYFGTCGGCALQHMRYEAQREHKRQRMLDNLQRLGNVAPEARQPDIYDDPRGYRRRARLGVRDVEKKGGILVGFRERRKSYVTPLATCYTLADDAQRLLPELATLISALSVRQRLPQVEVAAADNALALVFRHLDPLSDADRDALQQFASRHAVQVFVQPSDLNSVSRLDLGAPERLFYRLDEFGVTVYFNPVDFVQVNGKVNAKMVSQAMAHLRVKPGDDIIDFFCGLGNFSLPMARLGANVLGLEGEPSLVSRARENAQSNALDADFRHIDLNDDEALRQLLSQLSNRQSINKVLIDPPRSGALAVVQALGSLLPEQIVYVSCNPATLARDAGFLVHQLGYTLKVAGIVDMFPHTAHIETMTVFERRHDAAS